MTATLTERLVEKLSTRTTIGRRGLLRSSAVVGAALVTNPWSYLTRPASAYDAVCGTDATCADGYSVFCCTINNGQNTCPPDSFIAGWWKADQSSFCGGSARYYVDCNAFRGSTTHPCRCNDVTCDKRLVACNQFRYGQCHTEIPYSATGPVVCRLVSCTPPWQQYAGVCSTSSKTDNNTATHSAPCVTGAAPVGSLDTLTATGNRVRLTGWAVDLDQRGTELSVAVYEDGRGIAWFPTGVPRADVNAVYGTTGRHGFDIQLDAANGTHTYSVYAIGVGPGPANTLLANRAVAVNPGASPVGSIDTVTDDHGRVRLTGWALDQDQPATAIDVAVHVDGRGVAQFPTGGPRPDVNAAFGVTGAHGFDVTLDVPSGRHVFAVLGVNVGGGTSTVLGYRTVDVDPGVVPRGVLDGAVVAGGTVRLTGWAYDPDAPSTSIDVAVYVDGVGLSWFPADRARPDVNTTFGITGRHGFDIEVAATPGVHTYVVYAINEVGGSGNPSIGSRTVSVAQPGSIGVVDAATTIGDRLRLTGWAFDPSTPAAEIPVDVYVDGTGVARFPTGRPRPDVQAVYGVPGDHGFEATFPITPGTHTVVTYAIGPTGNRVISTRTVVVGAP